MCEDWTEGKWEAYHKRIAETKNRSTRARDGKSNSKVQQGEVLPGANSVPPHDGFGINPSACTNGSTGVIATGVNPSACTNGASEVKVAQIPSGQTITQQTMLSPTPKGVECLVRADEGLRLRPPLIRADEGLIQADEGL